MLARLSVLFIVALAAAALVTVGHAAFGSVIAGEGAHAIHRHFAALPKEAAYAAPAVAALLVVLAFVALRVLGAIITVAFTVVVSLGLVAVLFGAEAVDLIARFLAAIG